ncbi:MAG: NAD regulator [Hyphomicrobiaceae bacterium]
MHDDITRGAIAPTVAGGESWMETDDLGRQADSHPEDLLTVCLTAVVLSVQDEQPVVLVGNDRSAKAGSEVSLPSVRFNPSAQPCLEAALREAVLGATGRVLGFAEQLLTDYDRGGTSPSSAYGQHARSRCLSVSYIALMREASGYHDRPGRWVKCYDILPWEDFRRGRPAILAELVLPELERWAAAAGNDDEVAANRIERVRCAFGTGGGGWDDQRVVDRYDLIVEAGVTLPDTAKQLTESECRLAAAALGRLRAKIRYRPVVFELLPAEFTLFELQRTVEAVLGPTLHKQNFRRLVEGTKLVEATGEIRNNTGGRPAKTFRFRREVLLEQPAPGVHVRPGRAA